MSKYVYLSVDISVWLRLWVFASLSLLILFFGFKIPIPLWWAPVISTAGLILVIVINLGLIGRREEGDRVHLTVRDIRNNFRLDGPLVTDSWWHYIHRGKSKANDIQVIVRVEDAHGLSVHFSETIMFESRHPNDVPYRPEEIPEGAHIIKVQRVDKVNRFILGSAAS